MVVHIGEVFFDISIESAIRWCHGYAEMGVKRMAHCIVLGLDPEIALERRLGAHTQETVAERIDQIEYDLNYAKELKGYGIRIDKKALEKEKLELQKQDLQKVFRSDYDKDRINAIRLRQKYVRDVIKEKEIIIEICPTSNLLISGIQDMKHHPFNTFYDEQLRIAISTDDPGIFDTTLSDEVDMLVYSLGYAENELAEKLGDAYSYRLGSSRGL